MVFEKDILHKIIRKYNRLRLPCLAKKKCFVSVSPAKQWWQNESDGLQCNQPSIYFYAQL